MVIRTKQVKSLEKFKKLPRIKIPAFPYIKEVSIKTTLKDVLKVIRETKTVNGQKVRWSFKGTFGDCIRTKIKNKECCPVTFYCLVKTGEFYEENRYDKAAEKSRIPVQRSDKIVWAADKVHFDPFRKKLLIATGLLEQARKNGEKI